MSCAKKVYVQGREGPLHPECQVNASSGKFEQHPIEVTRTRRPPCQTLLSLLVVRQPRATSSSVPADCNFGGFPTTRDRP